MKNSILKMTILFSLYCPFVFASMENDNKEMARTFFNAVVNEKDFNKAAQFLGPWYIEHDPEGSDGPQGLKQYIDFLRAQYPNSHVEIKRIIADGDFVILHVHSILVPGTRGDAIVDLFRIANHKIVEHWDVTQAIPETSANANGMF